jgi:outer membrane protein insertion porin family
MPLLLPENTLFIKYTRTLLVLCLFFSSCNITRKAPRDKPYLFKNTIEVKGGDFNKLERSAVVDRLANQLDDSSKLRVTSSFIILNILKRPPAYDTAYSIMSAENMRASMYHIGYYNSSVSFKADTSGKKVRVHYTVQAGNPTRIDTFSYRLNRPDLQELANRSSDKSILIKGNPITKAGVIGEIGRMVDTFRNNGYYKFTASELRMRGDTTIAALTTISDDPFEQLQLLAEAQQKIDSPEIKLAVVLDQPEDSSRFNQYKIGKVIILQDYYPGDLLTDTVSITQRTTRNFVLRYHKPIFRTGFLSRNISFRPGQLFRQDEYNKTLNNLSKTNVWQSVNIQTKEVPDSNQVDLILELIPEKKFSFEASVEASYSATTNTSNALAGNLIGFSGNLGLTNKNIGREAIRMTHRLRAGIELNNSSRGSGVGLINSNEISYSNSVIIPRIIKPFEAVKNLIFHPSNISGTSGPGQRGNFKPGQTFINTNIALSNRLSLFNLQSFNLNLGEAGKIEKRFLKDWNYIFKVLNVEFSYLYNRTDSFNQILLDNRFLEYSYKTAFVMGMAGGISNIYQNPRHLKSLSKERSIKFNVEESGLTWLALPGINKSKYKSRFIKFDGEYKYTVNYRKNSLVFRGIVGVGIPLFRDSSLPFFKQFFGGGTNSMRGWPIRGIGAGGLPLPGYNKDNIFNDRRGDMQIELNAEYRYDIARIIPNLLTLKGAVFVDAGNVWNLRNSKTDGTTDSTQFKFKNLYQQMGLSAGTGFRLDFNYVVIRFDLGFRFKRPETSYVNDGWKLPPIGFNDFFGKLFSGGDENRRWRYENFNFTLGIGVPF